MTLNADDTHEQLLTFAEQPRRVFWGRFRHLAGVQQCFDAGFQADKRAELGHAAHFAFDELTNVVHLIHHCPGIWLQTLERQADTLTVPVKAQNVHVDLVTYRQQFARVLDAVPGQFADMDQAVGSAQVHECAKVAQAADPTTPNFRFLKLFQKRFLTQITATTLRVTLAG